MNTIILGAAGFIGTNLTLRLSKNPNNNIVLVDRNQDKLKRLQSLCKGNVYVRESHLKPGTDFIELLKGQDIVYQLVSSTVPATSNLQIPKEISDNVILMSELLGACVKCNVKKVIFLSSGGTVYGIKNKCPLKEENETYPINSYGTQKVMNEKLLYLYQYLYGLDYRIIRLANPFGPYQKPNGIQGAVAAFVYKALQKQEIIVYGDGSAIRDYIYIEDAVHAIISIADYEGDDKLFNVGSGKGTSILQLLKIIKDILGVELKISYQPGRVIDVPVNFLDITKYEQKFGKMISISLEEGIRRTAVFQREKYFGL